MTLKMTEENKEKLNIRLFVYDMEMPLRCDRSDEEYYRKAGKLITETLNYHLALIGCMDHAVLTYILA